MEIRLERGEVAGDGRSLPVYRQIAEHLREEVSAGRLQAGDRLPAIRELARSLGVNRDTVALAYDELATEGLVESTVGRGTFVATPQFPIDSVPEGFDGPALSPLVERLIGFEQRRPRYGAGRDTIPMHALVPDPSLYPVDEFRRAVARVLATRGADLLGYGGPQGDARLREVLAQRFGAEGVRVDADEVLISQGASQGISMALRLFAKQGDCVAVEEPTYTNVLATLEGLGLTPVPVPMRDDGLDLGVLAEVLARPDVKLLYTIPTFHNPMGITTPLAHRRTLLGIAAQTGKPVVEDAYEMDLRFAGRSLPTLAALDMTGLVVQLFSFSKSLFPGARVGSLVARGRALEGLLALRHATDLGGSLVLQAAIAEMVDCGAYERHLGRVRRTLRARVATAVEALERELPDGVRFTRPEGGYQIWVELPGGVDTRDVFADAAREGVLFAPGHQFHHDARPSSGLRLTLAQTDEDAIRRGVERLGRSISAALLERGSRVERASVAL